MKVIVHSMVSALWWGPVLVIVKAVFFIVASGAAMMLFLGPQERSPLHDSSPGELAYSGEANKENVRLFVLGCAWSVSFIRRLVSLLKYCIVIYDKTSFQPLLKIWTFQCLSYLAFI